jgi:hypothetical protein
MDGNAMEKIMDAATSKRKFPGYTLAQLEEFAAHGKSTPTMLKEIEDRKAGHSVVARTPQIDGGRTTPRIGRM